MSRRALPLLLSLFLPLFSGCATDSGTPPPNRFQPPAAGAEIAFLKGMEIKEPGMFGSDHTAYVISVGQLKVDQPEDNWDKPLAVLPGKRTIGVEYHYSNFHARAQLTVQLRPGVTYQLKIKPGREYEPDGPLFNEFWIEDTSNGQPVTDVAHRPLTGGKKGTIFYMNK